MARYTIALALLVAVVLGGCGGGSNSGPAPRDVVKQYFAALADGDANKTCGFLAPAAREDVANYAKAVGLPALSRCETAFRTIAGELTDAARATLRRARVTSLTIHADRATGTVSGATRPIELIRVDGVWRIAHLDFRYATFRVRAGKICTRYHDTIKALARPSLARASVLTWLAGSRSAADIDLRALRALGNPPERQSAWDAFVAGLAEQARGLDVAIARLHAGNPVQSVVNDFARRQAAPTRAVNAAQAKLEIHCGEATP